MDIPKITRMDSLRAPNNQALNEGLTSLEGTQASSDPEQRPGDDTRSKTPAGAHGWGNPPDGEGC